MVKTVLFAPAIDACTAAVNPSNGLPGLAEQKQTTYWETRGYGSQCSKTEFDTNGTTEAEANAKLGGWVAPYSYKFVVMRAGRSDWMYNDVKQGTTLYSSDCSPITQIIVCDKQDDTSGAATTPCKWRSWARYNIFDPVKVDATSVA